MTTAKIALTYASDQHMDGAGAQLQRIYGIYAIARHLNLPYLHSPIKHVGYQGLPALERNASSDEIELRFRNTFEIPSDVESPVDAVIHDLRNPDIHEIKSIEEIAAAGDDFHLVRILYPYAITDNNPELYRCVRWLTPFERKPGGPFRIAIHVRRGELHVVDSDRMLPNAYYLSVTLRLIEVLQKWNISFVCELHTETPSGPLLVTPDHHGIDRRIESQVVIDPAMDAIDDFQVLPNLETFVNSDPIEALGCMATADALIMSRSSFSYVAALLNDGGIPVYHPFWHARMQSWLPSDLDADIFRNIFEREVRQWQDRNRK